MIGLTQQSLEQAMEGFRGNGSQGAMRNTSKLGKKRGWDGTGEFNIGRLGDPWQFLADAKDNWYSLTARRGWLRLYPQLARASLARQSNLLLQKVPAKAFEVESHLEFLPQQCGEEAGMAVIGEKFATLSLKHDGIKNRVLLRTGSQLHILGETESNHVRMRVIWPAGGDCEFGFADNGKFKMSCFRAFKGTRTSAKLGFFSVKQLQNSLSGHADFDHFKFV